MNTAQLVVISYASLLIVGYLLIRTLDSHSDATFIAAIGVAAAWLVYFLKQHPLVRKRVVVASLIAPFVVAVSGYFAWAKYDEYQAEKAAERHRLQIATAVAIVTATERSLTKEKATDAIASIMRENPGIPAGKAAEALLEALREDAQAPKKNANPKSDTTSGPMFRIGERVSESTTA
jgi:hypothetical protein